MFTRFVNSLYGLGNKSMFTRIDDSVVLKRTTPAVDVTFNKTDS